MTTAIINIANQFSRTPAGRFASDGPFTGERFREEILRPALENNELVIVEMDGVIGYGSSFLEEAFGGLVRLGTFTKSQLHERLKLITRFASNAQDVWDYIDTAH